jgi:hypothetical protein
MITIDLFIFVITFVTTIQYDQQCHGQSDCIELVMDEAPGIHIDMLLLRKTCDFSNRLKSGGWNLHFQTKDECNVC